MLVSHLLNNEQTEARGKRSYMVNNLVRNPAIVLQNVKVLCADDLGDLLRDGLFELSSLVAVSSYTSQSCIMHFRCFAGITVPHHPRSSGIDTRRKTK